MKVLAFLFGLLWAASAYAQQPFFFPTVGYPPGCSASSYVGPGDLAISGVGVWVGLRAYSAATVCTSAIQVERLSDNALVDVKTTITGDLDATAVSSFSGTDATCTGTISGTTLSVSSCSGTLHDFDEISGTGINGPAFITSIGTCASPPGTCTLNQSQSVGVAETITARVATRIAIFYDQSKANNCSGSVCGYTAAGASRPYLYLKCTNGTLPCAYTQTSQPGDPATPTGTWNQPLTISSVANRPSFNSDYGFVWGLNGVGGCSACAVGFDHTSGHVVLFWSAGFTASASDNAWHAFQFVVNGTASVINVDNTRTTGDSGSSNPGSVPLIYAQNTFGHILPGYSAELGTWLAALSNSDQAAVCHNQFSYWGTSVSC